MKNEAAAICMSITVMKNELESVKKASSSVSRASSSASRASSSSKTGGLLKRRGKKSR